MNFEILSRFSIRLVEYVRQVSSLTLVRRGLCHFLIVSAVCVFHSKVLFHAETTFPWDFTTYHYPLTVAYADAIDRKALPLWDPYTYCGRPVLSNPQVAGFYPPMAAVAAWGRDGLLVRMEWLAVAHIALAGMFTFLLAVRLGTPMLSGLVAGVAFSLGPFFATQTQHLGMIMGSPWLVLSWYAIFCESRVRILLLSLAWTCGLLAGFTAFFLATVISTILFALFVRSRSRALLDLFLAAGLTTLLSLGQLGPSLELLQESVAKYRTDWMGFGGGIPPEALLTILAPNYFHAFEPEQFSGRADLSHMYLFLGWSTLVSIGLGMRSIPRWLIWLSLLLCLLMIGEWSPVGRLQFSILPVFLQRATYWYPYIAPFALAISLAAAFATITFGRKTILVLLTVGIELIAINSGRPMNSQQLDPLLAATIDPDKDTAGRRLLTSLRSELGDGRLDTINDSQSILSGAPIFGWRAAGGYDPMALEGVMRLRQRVAQGERWGASYQISNPNAVEVDRMSIRILTSTTPLIGTSHLEYLGEVPGRHVYKNTTALPRYRAKGCTVSVTSETANRIEIDLDCKVPSSLETSEAYFSAWRASLDDRPVAITVLDGAFKSISVDKGVHKAVFFYSTDSLAKYVSGSIAGLFAWVSIWMCPWLRSKFKSGVI